MPPRKQNPNAKTKAKADDDADLDAMLDAAIRENEAVSGSLAAQRLQQPAGGGLGSGGGGGKAAKLPAPTHRCAGCQAGKAPMKCGVCKAVRYCDEACQQAHWAAHKLQCQEMREAAAMAAAEAASLAKYAAFVKQEAQAAGGGKAEAAEAAEAGNCWSCGANNPIPVCNGCDVAKYCNPACQEENWAIHKGRCVFLKEHAATLIALKEEAKAGPQGLSRDQLGRDLYNASVLGRVVAVERLIAAGASVNFTTANGFCPIFAAAGEGHLRVIDALVQHGAQVDARIDDGSTALSLASLNGQVKAVAALLGLGAQVDSRDNDDRSPLYWASYENHPEVVTLLLQKGALVDLQDKTGYTPLGVSAHEGHAAVVRLLLQAGADPLHSINGATAPLDYATANDHPEVVALLQARIAELEREQEAQGALAPSPSDDCIPALTEASFTLAHCAFDEGSYPHVWRAKIDRHLAALTGAVTIGSSVLESCVHIPSLPRNFRARTRFSILHHEHGGLDYFLVDSGRRVVCKSYPVASASICQTMPVLLRLLAGAHVPALRRGLQVVSFLSTYAGELLVGLVYDRPIDEPGEGEDGQGIEGGENAEGGQSEWSTQAATLRALLLSDGIAEVSALSIMGRSRKVMRCVGPAFVTERLTLSDGRVLIYKQPEGAFSNPNTHVSRQALDWLCATIRTMSTSGHADLDAVPGTPTKNLLEMYCGNGNHTVALAPLCANVVAVELSEALCAAARENLSLNGITNATIVNTHAHKFSHKVLRDKKYGDVSFDMVLVDPPRAGLDAKTLSLVAAYDSIIYISCCPEALARDVALLQAKGGFVVASMCTMDQFAYSTHLELGVLLNKPVQDLLS